MPDATAYKTQPGLTSDHAGRIGNKVIHGHLDISKPRDSARFAFDMLDETAEKLEFGLAVRTMINPLLMYRALQMLVQMRKRSELPGAKIAFVFTAIPGGTRSPGIGLSIRVGVCKESLCDEVACIPGANFVVDYLTRNA